MAGNILDMPAKHPWKVFAGWVQRFGNIISLKVLGQTMIVVNSPQVAIDMLERKSTIYSDRPTLIMAHELVGWRDILAGLSLSDRFRKYRRLMHSAVGTRGSTEQFYPIEEQEMRCFLAKTLSDPGNFAAHARRMAGAVILQITYGYKVQTDNDPMVRVVDNAMDQFSELVVPGAYLVDTLPILRFLPSWFPGAQFKRNAKAYAATLKDMVNLPFNFTRKQMAEGTAPPSFVSNQLEAGGPNEEDIIRWAAASLYAGGADTTVSAICSFYLAMALYPEVQKKAQAEIDEVVGSERLPSFADRDRLPYVEALIKEVLRWNPVAPLGVPHRLREDDIHEGYLIPKDSIIIPNIWWFLHDPERYANPAEFKPERYLKADDHDPEPDPQNYCFGFGRRVCPGIKLADSSLFIACVMSLAVFDISKARDDAGNVIEPIVDYSTDIVSHPTPFACYIKPRSPRAETMIHGIQ